jgi:hypothetical protein
MAQAPGPFSQGNKEALCSPLTVDTWSSELAYVFIKPVSKRLLTEIPRRKFFCDCHTCGFVMDLIVLDMCGLTCMLKLSQTVQLNKLTVPLSSRIDQSSESWVYRQWDVERLVLVCSALFSRCLKFDSPDAFRLRFSMLSATQGSWLMRLPKIRQLKKGYRISERKYVKMN